MEWIVVTRQQRPCRRESGLQVHTLVAAHTVLRVLEGVFGLLHNVSPHQ